MSEMLDRVSEALRAALKADESLFLYHYADHKFPGSPNVSVEGDVDLHDLARAAIAAMREPTQDMKDAHPFTFDGGYEAAEVWQAMIDAALRDPR